METARSLVASEVARVLGSEQHGQRRRGGEWATDARCAAASAHCRPPVCVANHRPARRGDHGPLV
jgi:hypothetical protein